MSLCLCYKLSTGVAFAKIFFLSPVLGKTSTSTLHQKERKSLTDGGRLLRSGFSALFFDVKGNICSGYIVIAISYIDEQTIAALLSRSFNGSACTALVYDCLFN